MNLNPRESPPDYWTGFFYGAASMNAIVLLGLFKYCFGYVRHIMVASGAEFSHMTEFITGPTNRITSPLVLIFSLVLPFLLPKSHRLKLSLLSLCVGLLLTTSFLSAIRDFSTPGSRLARQSSPNKALNPTRARVAS